MWMNALETVPTPVRSWVDESLQRLSRLTRGTVFERHGWLAVVPFALVVATAFFLASRPERTSDDPLLFAVEPSDVTIRITERGELRALDSVTISAQKDYPIIFLVPEGTQVEKGELLVELDSSKYQAALEESEAAQQVSEANLTKAEREREAQELKLQAGLARFDADLRIAQLEMDELKKKPLPHELERATNVLENARLAFKNAENKRNFMPSLVEKGFVTRAALEKAELEYLEAKSNLSTAQFEYETTAAGATPQELQRAQIRLDEAKIAVEKANAGMQSELQSFEASVARERANLRRAEKLVNSAEVKLTRTVMYAPRPGIVVYATASNGSTEKVQLGMIPYQGQPILYLPDLSQMVVDTQVNEIDIGKVKEGRPVDVRLEAYPGAVFQGTVLEISSLAKMKSSAAGVSSGIKAFDVTVLVEGQDPRLKPGLTVVLDIVVDHQEDVLSVPLRAVTARRGEHVVYVAKSGRIEERTVELGLSNEHIVIVKQGLAPGERVLLGHSPS
jgi:HlyD family secretion protein